MKKPSKGFTPNNMLEFVFSGEQQGVPTVKNALTYFIDWIVSSWIFDNAL